MKVLVCFFVMALLLSTAGALAQSFEASPPAIKAAVEEGESVVLSINVLNKQASKDFSIEYNQGFFYPEFSSFTLDKSEAVSIPVIMGSASLQEGVYVGEINIKAGENILIPVILEVRSWQPSFAVSAFVLPSSYRIIPGQEFVADVTIYNLRSLDERADVEYSILDTDGNIMMQDFESVSVKNSLQLTKKFDISEDAEFGDYVFSVIVRQGQSVNTNTNLFSIGPSLSPQSGGPDQTILFVSFAVIAVLIMAFMVFNHYWTKRLKDNALHWSNQAVLRKKDVSFENIRSEMQKLGYQRELLQKAYNRGYIKKESYQIGMLKINSLINRLKKRL